MTNKTFNSDSNSTTILGDSSSQKLKVNLLEHTYSLMTTHTSTFDFCKYQQLPKEPLLVKDLSVNPFTSSAKVIAEASST